MSTKRKQRTVEDAFNKWWLDNGPHYSMPDNMRAHVLDWSRVAWANGYKLGQRREARKHTKDKS